MPIVGNVVGSFEYGSNPVPAISLVNNIFKKGQYAFASDDPDKKIKHTVGALTLGIGATFGIPGTLQTEQLTRSLLEA